MKYLITVVFIFCFGISFSQVIVKRSNGSQTVVDSNLFVGNSFRVAIFSDTTDANDTRPSLDSAGKLIFTRDINWFWGRQTSPDRKWVPFTNSSNGLTPTCGASNQSQRVTWDSLLTFDVSGGPYVICCDGIPRATNNTSITLDTNSTDFPRIDLIILDTSGVNWIKGIPAENPATPSTDSCQLILSYVLINAHDSMPANISPPTNPLIIYDENDRLTEWIIDTVSNVTADTANTIFPAHLVHSMSVSSFTSGNLIRFHTDTPIDLNNYGALKFYIRKTTVTGSNITLRWLLNGSQITFPLNSTTANGGTSGYIAYVIPIASFVLSGGNTMVNELQIAVSTLGAGAFYMDWIQLQSGTFISNITQGGGITSVGMNTLDSLLIPSVTNPTVSPVFSFTKYNIPPYRVLVNDSTGNAPYKWGQVDLGTSMITGLLPVTNLVPGNTGDYLGVDGGIVQWIPLGEDTTFVHNWIRRTTDPNSNNDTLSFGSNEPDSSVLAFETFVGLDSFPFHIQHNSNDFFLINPITFQSFLLQSDGTSESAVEVDANSAGLVRTNYYAFNGTNQVSMNADANNNSIIFDTGPVGGPPPAAVGIFGDDSYVGITGQLVITSFTPANSTDATYPVKTLTSDDSFIYYRKSNGTWVKIAWTAF